MPFLYKRSHLYYLFIYGSFLHGRLRFLAVKMNGYTFTRCNTVWGGGGGGGEGCEVDRIDSGLKGLCRKVTEDTKVVSLCKTGRKTRK